MEYLEKYESIKNRYLEFYDKERKDITKDIEYIEKTYKEDKQIKLINDKIKLFRYSVDTLQFEYEQEIQDLINLEEKEQEINNKEKEIGNKEQEDNFNRMSGEDKLIDLLTKQNQSLDKSNTLAIFRERSKEFDEEYLTELITKESAKEDKEIYNLVVSKVNQMDKDQTTTIRNTINELEQNKPEEAFKRFKGNFKYEQSGGYGKPSFSPNKLDNAINELIDPFENIEIKETNPFFK